MSTLRFKQVDVFTRVPFRGNPVAVVLGAERLDAAQMQRIAGWTNLSETTFVLPPDGPDADYRLRIFTPRAELPFAGHPTLGSAHAVLEAGFAAPRDGRLRQACGAGTIELRLEGERLWLEAPPARLSALDGGRAEALGRVLGAKAVGAPRVVDVGPVWLVAELESAEAVAGLAPDMDALARFTNSAGTTGVTVFGASSDGVSALHVRSFAPAHGIPEDPVCGSGNISVAAFIARTGRLGRYGASYSARQGMQLGRAGEVSIRIGEGGTAIELGGHAVTCVEGLLRVE
jgi:PhzF family phenazine biosynthesis protein